MKDNPDQLDDLQRAEWSRHFETIQWGVIAIFTAGVGALLAASRDDANSAKAWPELAGLALIMVGVFYVASLRGFRRQLYSGIRNNELRQFLSNQRTKGLPRMWDVFVLSFAVIGVVFSFSLAQKHSDVRGVFSAAIATLLCSLFYLWRGGRSYDEKDVEGTQDEEDSRDELG